MQLAEHGKVREAEMRMEVVNCKRGMSLPDGSWCECEDKRGAEKEGLHDVLRKVKVCQNIFLGLGKKWKCQLANANWQMLSSASARTIPKFSKVPKSRV